MSWEVDFAAKPFKLAVRKTGERGMRPVRFAPFAMPDSMYRLATRRVVARLAAENRELRMRPYRRASFLTTALASVIDRWATTHQWDKS